MTTLAACRYKQEHHVTHLSASSISSIRCITYWWSSVDWGGMTWCGWVGRHWGCCGGSSGGSAGGYPWGNPLGSAYGSSSPSSEDSGCADCWGGRGRCSHCTHEQWELWAIAMVTKCYMFGGGGGIVCLNSPWLVRWFTTLRLLCATCLTICL